MMRSFTIGTKWCPYLVPYWRNIVNYSIIRLDVMSLVMTCYFHRQSHHRHQDLIINASVQIQIIMWHPLQSKVESSLVRRKQALWGSFLFVFDNHLQWVDMWCSGQLVCYHDLFILKCSEFQCVPIIYVANL